MSKLLKKLKPGVRVIDIESGVEGYISYNRDIVPNNITIEFEPIVVMSSENLNIAAISYPISDIENRIKLAPKYGNYKVGDRCTCEKTNISGVISNINYSDEYPIEMQYYLGYLGVAYYCKDGRKYATDEKPVLKKLKVKQ
jgi:hypothetical protein